MSLFIALIFLFFNLPVLADSKPEVEYGSYMQNLQQCISLNWKPPRNSENGTVKIEFMVYKSGEIDLETLKITPLEKNLSNELIEAAAQAIKNSKQKCKIPLPEGAKEKIIVDLKFTRFKTPRAETLSRITELQNFDNLDKQVRHMLNTTDPMERVIDWILIMSSPNYRHTELLNGKVKVITNKNPSSAEKYIFDELQKTLGMKTFDFLIDKIKNNKLEIICIIADAFDEKNNYWGQNFATFSQSQDNTARGFIILDGNPDFGILQDKEINHELLVQGFPIAIILNEFNELLDRLIENGKAETAALSDEYQAASYALDMTWSLIIYAYYLKTKPQTKFKELSAEDRDKLFAQMKELPKVSLLKILNSLQAKSLAAYKERKYGSLKSTIDAQNAAFLLNRRLQAYYGDGLKVKVENTENAYHLKFESVSK